MDKPLNVNRLRTHFSLIKLIAWTCIFLGLILFFSLHYPHSSPSNRLKYLEDSDWKYQILNSGRPKSRNGFRVLVTGAAGFVGMHVSTALRQRGDGVVGLDNFNGYYEKSLKRAREDLLKSQGVFIVEGDINDGVLLTKLFKLVKFTHVMHLAAQAGVRYAMKNPGSYVHSNIGGFVSLLEVCKLMNPQPAIVWASSSSVYGLNKKVPFSEIDRTDNPSSLYAATKKAGEAIAHTYNHIHGLSITGLRFFTVYGPWGRPDMAYFFFTRDILKGKQISVFEGLNGFTVSRDFTYIDDIVKGCLGALDTATKSTGSGGVKEGPAQLRVYNLGNTSPVPVRKLVNILEKLLKVKANKVVSPMPANGDVLFTHANISLARRELGYKPTTDLQSGLKKFVAWYLDYYKPSGKKSSV
ncbi:UDP-glucuronate 4-epimerase 2 [Populus alba]|uniref:UDP-glucuronate 4-epimerase n=2 Tax=Populus TaxID=3689 RepID=A0A4U5Q372_POPAL|nr:UDP-glucuronate 4-epimerase 2-like [Populus alba]KAJ6978137.1 UDP-glucuronate 4-epimerase 2-like [Populus alba x Populus x berolinensis]TKS04554.1 UDP-glucuronate 4-epimerase 2-like [Populus alba]